MFSSSQASALQRARAQRDVEAVHAAGLWRAADDIDDEEHKLVVEAVPAHQSLVRDSKLSAVIAWPPRDERLAPYARVHLAPFVFARHAEVHPHRIAV